MEEAPQEPKKPAEPEESTDPVQEGPEADAPGHVPWWAHLRPPDVWNTPAPTLREEIARARRGDHLPLTGPWRTAEMVRAWISALINSVLLLLVHANRSAASQAVLVLFVVATALVVATR